MADHIKIRPANGTWVVRAGGAVLGETSDALELIEGDMPPEIYIPRSDIAMALLDTSETRAQSPDRGEANYFSIVAKSGVIKDAAWSYATPNPGLEAIAGYLTFHRGKVAVEEL